MQETLGDKIPEYLATKSLQNVTNMHVTQPEQKANNLSSDVRIWLKCLFKRSIKKK